MGKIVWNYKRNNRVKYPMVRIYKSQIKLNAMAYEKLGKPDRVDIGVDVDDKIVYIKPNNKMGMYSCITQGVHSLSCMISCKAAIDLSGAEHRKSYRVEFNDEGMLLFNILQSK